MSDVHGPVDLKVEAVFKQLTANAGIEDAFVGYIDLSIQGISDSRRKEQDAVTDLFSKLIDSEINPACKLYAEYMYKEENPLKSEALLSYLEHMVKNNVITSKPVCDGLLTNANLKYTSAQIWCAVFQLIRRIVGGIDYKGCCEVFRAVLDKCRYMSITDYNTPQMNVVMDVIKYILNRNVCLLPSYFALNEIFSLRHCEDKPPIHWAFGKLLSEFTETFRPVAQIVTLTGLTSMRPVIGHSNINAAVWRFDLRGQRSPLCGPLPYERDKGKQTGLIRYIITEANSVNFLTNTLVPDPTNRKEDVKQRYAEIEEQICLQILHLAEQQSKQGCCNWTHLSLRWRNIAVHSFCSMLYPLMNFPRMVATLYKKLVEGKYQLSGCARDHIMWILLQCIFSINRSNLVYEYITFLKLFDHLYPDTEPLPVPDMSKTHCVAGLAATSVWAYLLQKNAQSAEQKPKCRPLPIILRTQFEYLKEGVEAQKSAALLYPTAAEQTNYCFRLIALCNAYSKNDKIITTLVSQLMDLLLNTVNHTTLPHSLQCYMSTEPLSVQMLDALSVHTKVLLMQQIFSKIDNHAKSQLSVALSPALMETCARLLVYAEIEQAFGIKAFVDTVLPAVISSKCLSVIHSVVEMATYRLTHMQPHYRMMILSHLLDGLGSVHHNQMYIRYENTAASLLLSLANVEVQQQAHRSTSGKFSIVSHDSEELNKVLILTIVRAIHTAIHVYDSAQSGSWCKNILTKVFEFTPHSWSSHTLETFPPIVKEFFTQNHTTVEDKALLQRNVESDFTRWKSAVNDNERVSQFSRQGSERPLFLCVIWKCVVNGVAIHHSAYKILDALGPKYLSVHLRTLCDYIASLLQNCQDRNAFARVTDAINAMIWKYNIFTLDKFIMCLSLRTLEQKEVQVCMYAIQNLLMHQKFTEMVKEFSSTTSAEHWKNCKNYESHVNFHKKYPELLFYEGIFEANNMQGPANSANFQYLPSYFDNLCLRMLPVLDVLIHRLIEALKFGTTEKPLFTILEKLSCLFKYHAQPVTYLYNTLHFYYKSLKDKTEVKKKLVQGILGCSERLPLDIILSEELRAYLASDQQWNPSESYYYHRVKRLVDVIADEPEKGLDEVDWRFAEFSSAPAHVLYSTCAELLALPLAGEVVGQKLLQVVFKWRHLIDRDALMLWMNAIGLIITTLPEPYWQTLYTEIIHEFRNSSFLSAVNSFSYAVNPFEVFNFAKCLQSQREQRCAVVLALAHSIWHHSTIGQLIVLPKFIREQIKPLVKTEQQFLYLCHLIGPFLWRFHNENAYSCIELTVELYEILERVDRMGLDLHYIDPICDFFYHIKYMFVGDKPKAEIEKIIKNLRINLQLRLRFIAHHTAPDESGDTTVHTVPTPTNL